LSLPVIDAAHPAALACLRRVGCRQPSGACKATSPLHRKVGGLARGEVGFGVKTAVLILSPAIATIYGVEADALLGDVKRWASRIAPETATSPCAEAHAAPRTLRMADQHPMSKSLRAGCRAMIDPGRIGSRFDSTPRAEAEQDRQAYAKSNMLRCPR